MKFFSRKTRRNLKVAASGRTSRLQLETLEDRTVPAYTVTEFALPNPNSMPHQIKAGPDGNLWFNEDSRHVLARISPAGEITEVPLPNSIGNGFFYFEFGPDGNIWLGLHTNIVEMTPEGVLLHDYAIPSAATDYFAFSRIPITVGPDGNIWYTEPYVSDDNDVIGRLTPDGNITEFHIGGAFRGWADITTGPDGNLWFQSTASNSIGFITTDGVGDSFPIPNPAARGLTAGPDGNLWMTTATNGPANEILRVNTQGQVTGRFEIPTANSGAYGMTVGSDGALWFTEIDVHQIGRITTDGTITEIAVPHQTGYYITTGPDGNIWFAEYNDNQIGEIVLNHTFYVTNTADSGAGSFRQAILETNANPGPDTIKFSIGSGVQTIRPVSTLPSITDAVTIDGATQPGFGGTPIIELDGSAAGAGTNGLTITAGGSTVRGLVINRFSGNGLVMTGSGATGNVVEGNYIGVSHNGASPLTDAVGLWHGEGSANDATVNNNDGTLLGDTTFATGKVGQAFQFDGNGDYVTVPDSPSLDLSSAVTLEAWINPASLHFSPNWSAVIAKSDVPTFGVNGRNYGLWVAYDGSIGLEYWTSSHINQLQSGSGLIPVGTYSHVAGVIDPAAGRMEIYCNGILVASRVISDPLQANDVPLTIGASDPGINFYFDGKIDEPAVYNRGLSAAEIQNTYNAGSAGFQSASNGGDGIRIENGAHNNTIGGPAAGAQQAFASGGSLQRTFLGAVASNGDIIVVDAGSQSVIRIDPITGNQTIVSSGGNLTFPTGLALDLNGNIFIADQHALGTGAIIRIDPHTGVQTIVSSGQYFVEPNSLNFTPTGDLLVLNQSAVGGVAGVLRVDLTTGVQTIVSSGGHLGRMVIDLDGSLLATEYTGASVIRINPTTGSHTTVVSGSYLSGGTAGLAIAPNGDLLVSLQDTDTIYRIDRVTGAHTTLSTGGMIDTPDNLLLLPDGDLLVSNAGFHRSAGGLVRIPIYSERNVISGNLGNGIHMAGSGTVANLIQGNYIGTDVSGTVALANGGNGILLDEFTHANTIGGTDVGARNLISGNSNCGIEITGYASATLIQGNYIGTDVTGMAALGNYNSGIYAFHSGGDITIGGTVSGARNVIAGNGDPEIFALFSAGNDTIQGNYVGVNAAGTALLGGEQGIIIQQTQGVMVVGGAMPGAGNVIKQMNINRSDGTLVQGNYIGTNAAGTVVLGQELLVRGLYLGNCTNCTIGGTALGAGNVIAALSGPPFLHGSGIIVSLGHDNVIQGNYIGTNRNGDVLGCRCVGVLIEDSYNNTIGGTEAGAGNTIAFCGYAGVFVNYNTSIGNTIRDNSIHDNTGLGIDLSTGAGPDGATLNDPGDDDIGPNNLQNFPVLVSAFPAAGSTTIAGSLDGAASTTVILDFYADTAGHSSGYGEGQRYLGSATVVTDSLGNVSFSVVLGSGLSVGEVLTATATDSAGNTSEFSRWIVPISNIAPTANAGGPYVIVEGQSLILNGSGSHDPDVGDALTYSWDVNGDGTFGDAMGVGPTLSWTQLVALGLNDGLHINDVTVRVDDGHGHVVDSTATTLTINNAPPTAAIAGPVSGVRGQSLTFTLTSADASSVDQAAGFTFRIDWDGDNVVDQTIMGASGTTVTHTYAASGNFTVRVTAEDKDQGISNPASISVAVQGAMLQPDACESGSMAVVVGGTTGNDTIVISPVGNSGALQVTINGASLGTFLPTGRIIVFAQAGDDDVQVAGSIGRSAWLYGGAGNDRLKGGAGADVLLGEVGDDLLVGGDGRDLLIGGLGADRIVGNGDDDILIAGLTSYDANEAALCAVMHEWTRTDAAYLTRIAHLVNGTGLNGACALNASTVINDTSADTLTGSSGQDWFVFDDDRDIATDLNHEAFLSDLAFING